MSLLLQEEMKMNKTQLKSLFTNLLVKTKQIDEEFNGVLTNPGLNDIGKDKAIELLRVKHKDFETSVNHIKQVVSSLLVELENKWKSSITKNLSDGGYQSGLSNAALLLSSDNVSIETGMNLIDFYKDDFMAMETFRATLRNKDSEVHQVLLTALPKDFRERTRDLLGKLERNVNEFSLDFLILNRNSLNSMVTRIHGILNFLDNDLNDDLEAVK